MHKHLWTSILVGSLIVVGCGGKEPLENEKPMVPEKPVAEIKEESTKPVAEIKEESTKPVVEVKEEAVKPVVVVKEESAKPLIIGKESDTPIKGENPHSLEDWESLVNGKTREQVIKIIGRPDNVVGESWIFRNAAIHPITAKECSVWVKFKEFEDGKFKAFKVEFNH